MGRRLKAVAILGCGPAGLLAAHAAALAGQPVAILSYGKKSRLGGAQFLHEPIPELTDTEPDVEITYRRSGSALWYEEKAYGDGARPSFVSFDGVTDGMTQLGWNLRGLYDRLWDQYAANSITETELSPRKLQEIIDDKLFSLVVSSIPLTHLCKKPQMTTPGGHRFTQQAIMIHPGVCHGGNAENTIWYDGNSDVSWYRSSNLFGVASTEWGVGMAARLPYNIESFVRVQKPVSHQCDCWEDSDKLIKVGRFGRWQKGVLTHDAFRTTIVEMHERGIFSLPERVRP